jgi:hypothetical protein
MLRSHGKASVFEPDGPDQPSTEKTGRCGVWVIWEVFDARARSGDGIATTRNDRAQR